MNTTRLAAWRKEADPLQLQGKWGNRDLGQDLADIEEGGAVDLTDETEGEMELFRWGPAGARQAAAEQGQMIANGLWRVDGNEEALVHGRWFWEERKSHTAGQEISPCGRDDIQVARILL